MCDSNPNKVPQTEQKLRDNVKASEKQHIKASEQKQALGHHQGKRTRRWNAHQVAQPEKQAEERQQVQELTQQGRRAVADQTISLHLSQTQTSILGSSLRGLSCHCNREYQVIIRDLVIQCWAHQSLAVCVRVAAFLLSKLVTLSIYVRVCHVNKFVLGRAASFSSCRCCFHASTFPRFCTLVCVYVYVCMNICMYVRMHACIHVSKFGDPAFVLKWYHVCTPGYFQMCRAMANSNPNVALLNTWSHMDQSCAKLPAKKHFTGYLQKHFTGILQDTYTQFLVPCGAHASCLAPCAWVSLQICIRKDNL